MDQDYQPVRPRRATDERGQLLPITEEELRIRNQATIEGLKALAEIGTEEQIVGRSGRLGLRENRGSAITLAPR